MPDIKDPRLNVVNLFDGFIWRLGKAVRRVPLYDRLNAATMVRWFSDAAAAALAEMPQEIDIETVNRCNGDCGFCPARAGGDTRPLAYIPDDLLAKLAAELAAEKYSGTIAPFINNEPLIDERIVRIVGDFRKACPAANIVLCTNGRLLTPDKYFALFDADLSHLVINNYHDKNEFTPAINAALEGILAAGHPRMRQYMAATAVLLRNKNEVLNSRAGEAPNKAGQKRYMYYRRSSCMYPFRQFCVLPSGKVSLCCEDFSGRVTLGDVSKDTVKTIWNGPAFTAVREGLRKNGRTELEPCLGCDYGHLGVDKAKTLLRYFVDWFSRF